MFDRFSALRPAYQSTGTARNSFAFNAFNIRATYGTFLWQRYFLEFLLPRARHYAHDFGNHIAGTPDVDLVANTNILALDLIHIMQGRVTDSNTTNEHRLQSGNGCNGSSTANLKIHICDKCNFFLGRKFMGNGPAWCTCNKTKPLLQAYLINLVDNTIDIVR